MVSRQASPPSTLETGSAAKTPSTPMPSPGSRSVSGATMKALRSREKNTALLERPSPTNTDCPMNWKDIQKKAAK